MAESRFHTLLKQKVTEHMKSRIESLIAGSPGDYPAYREHVGYLRGLNDALELADEINKEHY